MKAKYFYERLKKYPEESAKRRKYYYGYSNQVVRVHRKNNNYEYDCIHVDGSVDKMTIDDSYNIINSCHVDALIGDDFELFNPVQIVKSGYLVLGQVGSNPITNMERVISKLHDYIDSLDTDTPYSFGDKSINIPRLCGGSCWNNGTTDYITYHAINGIELHVRTIKSLCKENVERKYYDARPIPFIKSMDNTMSIHVSFVHFMNKNNYKEIRKQCNESLKDLLNYMDAIGVKCKWVDCKMRYPVYL